MSVYRSPYEAYPFLCDDSENLCCDFELLTDEIASYTGLLRSLVKDDLVKEDLLWICELVYHINPTLRTFLSVTEEEKERLLAMVNSLQAACKNRCKQFVLTQGCKAACIAHILRVRCKALVRLIYRHIEKGHEVPDRLLDLSNLLSGYFFHLALYLNDADRVEEIPYISRNYQ